MLFLRYKVGKQIVQSEALSVKCCHYPRYDFREAGKCIAYDRATAAAFHLMRATEAVLGAFYKEHIKRNRVNQPMWGNMVQGLRQKKKLQNDAEYTALFNNLDNIRTSFRNPTQHPEKTYDIHEAQDLWSLSVDVINRMAKDLSEQPVLF